MPATPSRARSDDGRLLIVQPWFSAKGHPAQSLYNTMRTLAAVAGIDYLVSSDRQFKHHAQLEQALGPAQRLHRFAVSGSSLPSNTAMGLLGTLRIVRGSSGIRHVFFLDMHLVTVAVLWPLLAWLLGVERLTLLYLAGPERIASHWPVRQLVARLLRRSDVTLGLRTEELRSAWADAFADVPSTRFRTIPSLEIPDGKLIEPNHPADRTQLRFGILGQLRRGKSIETFVPLFAGSPGLGALTVAGAFNSDAERDALQLLRGFAGFDERYLEDAALLALAAAQDYLLVFYDHWDSRMESAVLYLGARANRPVLAYSEGWCGRTIEQFGCGITRRRGDADWPAFLAQLPLPGSPGYAQLLAGMERFRAAHQPAILVPEFLDCVGYRPAELAS